MYGKIITVNTKMAAISVAPEDIFILPLFSNSLFSIALLGAH